MKWKLVISISFFIGAFCVVFMPFGMDNYPYPEKYYKAFGFGGVTFIMTFINMIALPYFFPRSLTEKVWTVGKEVIWVGWMVFSIASLNYIYTVIIFNNEWSVALFFWVQSRTLVIAFIPALGVIFFKETYKYRKVLKEVAAMNNSISFRNQADETEILVFRSNSGNEKIELDIYQVYCIESSGNYVEIFFKEGNNIRKFLLRNRISKIEKQLEHFEDFIRCHRTHIVNLSKVEKVRGNSQGYKLKLHGIQELVPVARSCSKRIRELMASP